MKKHWKIILTVLWVYFGFLFVINPVYFMNGWRAEAIGAYTVHILFFIFPLWLIWKKKKEKKKA